MASLKVSAQVLRRDAVTLDNVYRTYNNVNMDYVGMAPYPTPPALPYVTTEDYDEEEEQMSNVQTAQATSFAGWADTVARSLGKLTNDTYVQTNVTAVFSDYVGGDDNG